MQLLLQIIFWVSPSSCKHFYLLVYTLFQCLQPLQTIYFTIFQPPSTPPPPPLRQKIMVRPLKLKPCRYSVRADFLLVFCFNRKKFWQKRKKPTRKRIEIQGTDLKGTTQKGKIDATTKQGSTKRKRQPGKIWQKKVKILNT